MLAVGVAIPIGDNTRLDLSYRYTDAGEIRTDIGDITIVLYREDGTRRAIPVTINETSADYRTHSLLATLRFALHLPALPSKWAPTAGRHACRRDSAT